VRKSIRAGIFVAVTVLIGVGASVSGIQNKPLFYVCMGAAGILFVLALALDPIWSLFRPTQRAVLTRTDKEVRIVNLLHGGAVLRARAPRLGAAPHSEVPFNRDVDRWMDSVSTFLSGACAPGASAYFMDVRDLGDFDDTLYSDVWASAELLDRRMEKLKDILDQGDRYL